MSGARVRVVVCSEIHGPEYDEKSLKLKSKLHRIIRLELKDESGDWRFTDPPAKFVKWMTGVYVAAHNFDVKVLVKRTKCEDCLRQASLSASERAMMQHRVLYRAEEGG